MAKIYQKFTLNLGHTIGSISEEAEHCGGPWLPEGGFLYC